MYPAFATYGPGDWLWWVDYSIEGSRERSGRVARVCLEDHSRSQGHCYVDQDGYPFYDIEVIRPMTNDEIVMWKLTH